METKRVKDEYFLDMAEVCARQGTCLRRRFGAVLVDDDNRVISTGYNGAPCDQMDCLEFGTCWREENNIPSGSNYEKCRSIHAEQNALLYAGQRAHDSTMYLVGIDAITGNLVDAYSCFLCVKMMLNAGVLTLVCRQSDGSSKLSFLDELYDEDVKKIFGE